MDFRILGPIEAIEGNRQLALGGSKQRALLGMLLLHANEVVSTDRLIEELWPSERRRDAVRALQVSISRLRKALEPETGVHGHVIVTRAPGYVLQVDPGQLDAERFERLVDEGRQALARGDARWAHARLEEALTLWRGPPLADLAYESFCQAEVARLEELRLAALEAQIDADLALGRHATLIGEVSALVGREPLRERLRAQLMLALYRSGRQAEALDVYTEARGTLVEELGIEPSRELRELHQAILEQDPALDPPVPEPTSEPARDLTGAVFVGRETELAELVAGLDDVLGGHGRLFLLVGEPGIGKSRLSDELIDHAVRRGARVLVGRCWEAGGAPAYWPWVQLLRAYVREVDAEKLREQLGTGAAELAQIVPELRDRFPDLPEPLAPQSEAARFRLFDATTQFLGRASADQPLLLVLDDLHAADTPSLLLLRFLARALGSSQIFLLGAFRDVDPTPGQPLTEMLAEVAREPSTRRMTLRGLSRAEIAEYVELTASQIASSELVAGLHEETEGNPLFVGEIVRLLAREELRSDSGTEPRRTVPQSVRDVIGRRLGYLSEECNRVLVLASILGREFAVDVLARMAGASETELLDLLDEAMTARAVSDAPGGAGRVRFAHVLIRDALYDGLTSARRVRLHRTAVEALEVRYGHEPGAHLAELAHHAIAGSDFDRGLVYARRAGDWALALLAYEEGARLYQTALDALQVADPGDERARCRLLLALGEAEVPAGNTAAAKSAFLDAADIARRLGLAQELARAAAGYGGRFMWARAAGDERLVPLLEEGLAGLGEEDVVLRARLLARLSGVLRDELSRERRERLSREAVELARRAEDPVALAFALDGRAAAISAPDTVAECLAVAAELRDVAESIDDLERVVNALDHRRTAQVMAGDLSGAEAGLAAEIPIAEDLRQPFQMWQLHSAQAMLALARGRLQEAEELMAKTLEWGEPVLPAVAIPVYRLQRLVLCDFEGRLHEAVPAIRDAVTEYPTRPVFRCALAYVDARLGSETEVRQALDELAEDDFAAVPFDQEWLYSMSLLSEAYALVGDTDRAAVLHRLLLPWAHLNAGDHPEGIRGSVSRYLGILATAVGRLEQAERHHEEALAANARMEAHPWLAHTQADLARTLQARDGPGDRERARELLKAASDTYRRLGMHSWIG